MYRLMSSASKQSQLRRNLVLPKNHLKLLNAGDDDDADLHYADSYEREQADIDPEGYQNLFGDSDSEDFNGF